MLKVESKVYGPYQHDDHTGSRRSIVIVYYADGSKKTMSHARYIMEYHLGRELSVEETVDHIDENPLNDELSNLQILSLADNVRKSITPAAVYEFNCPQCGEFSIKSMRHVKHNWKQGNFGPYCSRSCAGKVHH